MNKLIELASVFLKLGTVGFGGPAAHIAMMHDEVVKKRKWMDEQHFLDLIGATNIIPGPNSTEMTMHIGHEYAGWKGLVIAGLCFILPAVTITGVFAVLYKQYGQLPHIQPFVYGIKPAIIAVIVSSVFPLARKSIKTAELWGIALFVFALNIAGIREIPLLFGAGPVALGLAALRMKGTGRTNSNIAIPFIHLSVPGLISTGNTGLFLIFLKIGAILYGSGYVLFAFLDTELVVRGLITRQQLVDAIAVGQFTPGPLFSSVTFIGYQISSFKGAFLATIGIFLPSFLFVALLNPIVRLLRNSKPAAAFLDAVNVASIAIIAAICIKMGKDAILDWRSFTIAVSSFAIVFGLKRINSAIVVLGGAGLGFLLSFF